MKTKIIKILCLFTVAGTMIGSLAGCKKKTKEPSGTDPASTGSTETDAGNAWSSSGLEKRTFDGKDMNIWYSFGLSAWSPLPLRVTEEENATSGDIVTLEGYKRNAKMKEDFKLNDLKYTVSQTHPNNTSDETKSEVITLRNLSTSGDLADYDMIMVGTSAASTLAREGILYDIATSKYIKPESYYYESSVNKQIALNGHQFFASGFYSVKNTAAIDVTIANKKIIEDTAHLSVNDLYNMVLDKTWTMDELLRIGYLYASEDNSGAWESDEHYALILSRNYCHNIFYDLGGNVIENETNGRRNYSIVIENDANQNLLTWIQNKLTSDPKVAFVKNDKHDQAFAAECSPFMIATYNTYIEKLSDTKVENEVTILPPPLKERGEEYRAYSDQWNLNFAAIPAIVSDPDKATYLYEAFMCYSYDYVYPAYYELCFGSAYQPDLTSCKVFDIVAHARVVCFANIYGLFGTKNVNSIVGNTQNGVGSTVKTIHDEVKANLDGLVK